MWEPATGLVLVGLLAGFLITSLASSVQILLARPLVSRSQRIALVVLPFLFLPFLVAFPVAVVLGLIAMNVLGVFLSRRRIA